MKKRNTTIKFPPNPFQRLKSMLVIFLCFFTTTAFTQNYYVSPGGSNSNDGLSTSSALQTISKAAEKVQAGGTVFIMNGTYNTTGSPLLDLKKSGTSSQYITFKNYSGHTPKLTASGSVWNIFLIDASYVIVEGLEFQGNNANITYAAAKQSYDDYEAGSRDWAKFANFNTNAITIGQNQPAHHVTVRNCKVHDFAGGGISGSNCDYITFEGNTVYNNSWFTMYATSGISILAPKSIDQNTGYKIIIRNNICYSNKTTVPWEHIDKLSDGNGIIMDVNTGYVGRTLVENNVSYNNGGSGIHAFKASHVDILNNTAYNNGTVVGYEEIFSNAGTDNKIINNIMYARSGGKVTSNYNNTNVTYNYNVYFNGPAAVTGPNDIVADPQFVKLALDGSADFRLKSTSPAIDNGSNTPGQFSTTDKLGITRPQGAKPDRGAYEFVGSTGGTSYNIPGKVEAENYSAMNGIQTESTTDTGGGQNVGWVGAGDWMDYSVNVTTAGTYTINYRVASQTGGGKITLRKGTTDYHTVDVPSTGAWQTWTTVSATATLTAGTQTLRIFATAAGFNLNWFEGVAGSTSTLRNPENPTNTVNGLNYSYYEGNWSALPDFNALTAAETGTVTNFDLSPKNRNDQFGFRYTGYINVATDGNYTFYTSSDDGSKLYIGTTEVVNNDGLHASLEKSGTIGLKAGKHAITVTFFEQGGGELLSVSYAGPSLSKTVVPATALYRSTGGKQITELEVRSDNETLMVHPNPATNTLHISAKDVKSVVLYNVQGVAVIQPTSNYHTVEISTIPSGMYLLKVKTSKAVHTRKVLKQ